MERDRLYFFCGIGGSGMLPLALIVQDLGFAVAGSDRSLDQGRTGAKFDFLRARGIPLFPQDGSGVTSEQTVLVASAAVEDTVPDVQAARRLQIPRLTRAELLASLFNQARVRVGVAGTSGKSTTTGMIGWILDSAKARPTIVNGAVMKNYASADQPFASALSGSPDLFVCEIDESDGSIARFDPTVAVVNNIALDHKPLAELRPLFQDFCARGRVAVLNADQDETRALAERLPAGQALTYSLEGRPADLVASDVSPAPDGIAFTVRAAGEALSVRLAVPGRHNAANALAALLAAGAAGIPLKKAVAALAAFRGIERRLETVGTAEGITVIDDFAHNPDKIAASLTSLHDFPGRLLIMFQPHGFGPLRLMKEGFIATFADKLAPPDVLLMPEPLYFGGTVERTVTSQDIVAGIVSRGRIALALPDRDACRERLLAEARPGDRIVVMGARDDTLSVFARDLVSVLAARWAKVRGSDSVKMSLNL